LMWCILWRVISAQQGNDLSHRNPVKPKKRVRSDRQLLAGIRLWLGLRLWVRPDWPTRHSRKWTL